MNFIEASRMLATFGGGHRCRYVFPHRGTSIRFYCTFAPLLPLAADPPKSVRFPLVPWVRPCLPCPSREIRKYCS
jgi:hypothetical protein